MLGGPGSQLAEQLLSPEPRYSPPRPEQEGKHCQRFYFQPHYFVPPSNRTRLQLSLFTSSISGFHPSAD